MKKSPYFNLLCLSFLIVSCQAPSDESPLAEEKDKLSLLIADHPERAGVEATILDYVEALYLVDSTRIEQSVHPELRKRGYWYNEEEEKYYDNLDMTYEQLRKLAANWNESGEQANETTIKKIDIYDVNDRTASAKLTAAWGIDYFHLAKLDGKWYIMNVLWQSIPASLAE
jgi:hypothetical protein